MAFWNDTLLEKRLPALISPYNPGNLESNSYQLTVGSKAYLTSDDSNKNVGVMEIGPAGLSIPSGQFALIETHENIRVPNDTMAFISIRAKTKFRGLINVSGFHVDPGYDSKLVFSVYNAGPKAIHVSSGQDIFLIWYADLSVPNERAPKPRDTKINSELINNINSEVISTKTLTRKFDDTKGLFNKMSLLAGVLGTLGSIAVVYALSLHGGYTDLKIKVSILENTLNDRITITDKKVNAIDGLMLKDLIDEVAILKRKLSGSACGTNVKIPCSGEQLQKAFKPEKTK